MAFVGSALSGLRADTPDKLILDAGAVWVNFNVTQYLSATTPAGQALAQATLSTNTWTDPNGSTVAPRKLGATRGGTTITLNKQERQVEADGRRTTIKGFQRVDMIEPRISTSLIEVADYETLKLALGSATVTTYTNFRKVQPTLYPVAADYLGNVVIVATINGAFDPLGNPIPVAVVMENARVNNVNDITFTDKSETTMQVEIVAHALASDAFSIPMYVLLPKTSTELISGGYYQ